MNIDDPIAVRIREMIAELGKTKDRPAQHRLQSQIHEIRAGLRNDLANRRGWIVARRNGYYFHELATGRRHPTGLKDYGSDLLDHEETFRSPERPYRLTAILTHSYRRDDHAAFQQLADAAGLAVEFLPYSWYYPGSCIAALFTRPPGWRQAPSRQEQERAEHREFVRQLRGAPHK